jgi:hypothetical protein
LGRVEGLEVRRGEPARRRARRRALPAARHHHVRECEVFYLRPELCSSELCAPERRRARRLRARRPAGGLTVAAIGPTTPTVLVMFSLLRDSPTAIRP